MEGVLDQVREVGGGSSDRMGFSTKPVNRFSTKLVNHFCTKLVKMLSARSQSTLHDGCQGMEFGTMVVKKWWFFCFVASRTCGLYEVVFFGKIDGLMVGQSTSTSAKKVKKSKEY